MSLEPGGMPGLAELPARPVPAQARRGGTAPGEGLVVAGVARGFRGRPILREVSLSAPRGSCVLVTGPNGVGKTTLLRVVAGIITPDAGSVRFDGIDPTRDRRAFQRRLGLLTAGDRGLYARLTVRQNLQFWAKIALLSKERQVTAVARDLERYRLSDLAERRSDRLSMGQRQRVRLALTFLHEPDLVLLDEPTTSLDQEGGDLVREAVEQTTSRGGTVLWCAPTGETHAFPFDRALEIDDGRLTG